MLDDVYGHVGLRRPPPIDRRGPDTSPARDLGEGGAAVPGLEEDGEACLNQRLVKPRIARPAGLTPRFAHAPILIQHDLKLNVTLRGEPFYNTGNRTFQSRRRDSSRASRRGPSAAGVGARDDR